MNSPMNNQHGAALFMSLIFLLILTILGISSMNDSVMQTKMSAAIQDSNIALQGSESALRDAENYIETNVATIQQFTDTGTAGLYSADSSALPNKFSDADWSAANTITAATVVTGLLEQPRYYIQYVGFVNQEDANTSINVENDNHRRGGGDVHGFKTVARSTGASGTTQRIIESFYGKRF